MIHFWMGQQNKKFKICSSSWINSPFISSSPSLSSFPTPPSILWPLLQASISWWEGLLGQGCCHGWSRLLRAFALCIFNSGEMVCWHKWESLPRRFQSIGDSTVVGELQRKKKRGKISQRHYLDKGIWPHHRPPAPSIQIPWSQVSQIVRVCYWWAGVTQQRGRKTTNVCWELPLCHVLFLCPQILSLGANNTNDEASKHTQGHYMLDIVLGALRILI